MDTEKFANNYWPPYGRSTYNSRHSRAPASDGYVWIDFQRRPHIRPNNPTNIEPLRAVHEGIPSDLLVTLVDTVAYRIGYVRHASVYKDFTETSEFNESVGILEPDRIVAGAYLPIRQNDSLNSLTQ
jgi:hypothetical protein